MVASCGLPAYRKKLVATACRGECVYKRTGKPSGTFCEDYAATERMRKVRTKCEVFEGSEVRCDVRSPLRRRLPTGILSALSQYNKSKNITFQ